MLYVLKRKSYKEVEAFFDEYTGTLDRMQLFLSRSQIGFNEKGRLQSTVSVNGASLMLEPDDFVPEPYTEERFKAMKNGAVLLERPKLFQLKEKGREWIREALNALRLPPRCAGKTEGAR